MTSPHRSSALALAAVVVLLAGCGGSGDGSSESSNNAVGTGVLDDVDLSVDLDELDAQVDADQATLDDVDLSQGLQCASISNQVVDDLTEAQVAKVSESVDGCIFSFGFSDFDPLQIDTYTKDIFVSDAQASADLLLASTGGRSIEVQNALSAYVFEDGFTPDNLPARPDDGSLGAGRQVVGYFMGTRGVRVVAVFPDAVVGIYDGSDAEPDEAARSALFEELIAATVYAGG
jgi:hypothetical protein